MYMKSISDSDSMYIKVLFIYLYLLIVVVFFLFECPRNTYLSWYLNVNVSLYKQNLFNFKLWCKVSKMHNVFFFFNKYRMKTLHGVWL